MRQAGHQTHLGFSGLDEMAQQSDDDNLAQAVNHRTAAAPWGERFFEKNIRHRL